MLPRPDRSGPDRRGCLQAAAGWQLNTQRSPSPGEARPTCATCANLAPHLYADRLELTRELPEELRAIFPHLPDGRTRAFDLTHVFTDSGKTAAFQRLDRLAVGYSGDHLVMRFGRQAITWGNGLVYNVMDIFNPFDPAAVDKEYKTGDDMLYGQYLHSSGNDVQGVAVFRRDPLTGDLEADHGSLALKYHHMASISEYDVLVAQHYGDTLVGAGVNYSIGGAVWRGDLVLTFGDDDTVLSGVASISQSWTWGGKNVSGVAEYFYNGFGRTDGCYSPECLASSPELLERIARGELFNLGRHYVALSAMIEVNPLFLLTPNVFLNVTDPSALVQVVFQNDLRENLMLWSAVNLPVGGRRYRARRRRIGRARPLPVERAQCFGAARVVLVGATGERRHPPQPPLETRQTHSRGSPLARHPR